MQRLHLDHERTTSICIFIYALGVACRGIYIKNSHIAPLEYVILALAAYKLLEQANNAYRYTTNQYTLWQHEKNSKDINLIETKFETLSDENKEKLVSNGLAEYDNGKKDCRLKYQCPISHALICDPIAVQVLNKNETIDVEIYDKHSFNQWINFSNTNISPFSRRPLVKINGKPVIKPYQTKEHKKYITDLCNALEKIELETKKTL